MKEENEKKENINKNEETKTNNNVNNITLDDIKETTQKILNDVKDDTDNFTKDQIDTGRSYAIISYIFFLPLISYFTQKDNPFAYYHAKEGLNLFIWELIITFAVNFICSFLTILYVPLNLIASIFVIVLSLIGIVNVFSNKAKELPILNKVKIIK